MTLAACDNRLRHPLAAHSFLFLSSMRELTYNQPRADNDVGRTLRLSRHTRNRDNVAMRPIVT